MHNERTRTAFINYLAYRLFCPLSKKFAKKVRAKMGRTLQWFVLGKYKAGAKEKAKYKRNPDYKKNICAGNICGEKPHKCGLEGCDAAFTSSGSLTRLTPPYRRVVKCGGFVCVPPLLVDWFLSPTGIFSPTRSFKN